MKRLHIIGFSDSAVVITVAKILLRLTASVCCRHIVVIYSLFKALLKTAVTVVIHRSKVVHGICVTLFDFALEQICNKINDIIRQVCRLVMFGECKCHRVGFVHTILIRKHIRYVSKHIREFLGGKYCVNALQFIIYFLFFSHWYSSISAIISLPY